MAEITILCLMAIFLIGFLVYSISSGGLGSSGSSTTVFMGAAHDMLTEDQRRAAEVLVEQQSGNKTEEQTSGESTD
ncbi:hypothetical protein ACFL2X_07650 [Candidatus Latescibacterota bacterium]